MIKQHKYISYKHTMSNQLIFINIKIPAELLPDDDINMLNEYMEIEFSECAALPEKRPPLDMMEKLLVYLKNRDRINTESLMVLKNEIKTTVERPINSSFRKRQYKLRQTIRNFAQN